MRQQDENAIRRLLAAFPDRCNRHDMEALVQLFAENADIVVMTGKLLQGRGQIRAHHAELQSTAYKESQLTWSPAKIRFLRPDVAIAHVATEIAYNGHKRASFATLILTSDGDDWLIEALQNTLTSGHPALLP